MWNQCQRCFRLAAADDDDDSKKGDHVSDDNIVTFIREKIAIVTMIVVGKKLPFTLAQINSPQFI